MRKDKDTQGQVTKRPCVALERKRMRHKKKQLPQSVSASTPLMSSTSVSNFESFVALTTTHPTSHRTRRLASTHEEASLGRA